MQRREDEYATKFHSSSMERPEDEYSTKLHSNSIAFIEFAQQIAGEYAVRYQLNTRIYPYILIALRMSKVEATMENFIRVSTKPSAKDRSRYRSIAEMPALTGVSRFPYWENVRLKNLEFFMENVMLLMPEVDMKKIEEWKVLIPDLEHFTNERVTAEIKKLLQLFKDSIAQHLAEAKSLAATKPPKPAPNPDVKPQVLTKDDIELLWEFFHTFIVHGMKYIIARRQREAGYLDELDLERELPLFGLTGHYS